MTEANIQIACSKLLMRCELGVRASNRFLLVNPNWTCGGRRMGGLSLEARDVAFGIRASMRNMRWTIARQSLMFAQLIEARACYMSLPQAPPRSSLPKLIPNNH